MYSTAATDCLECAHGRSECLQALSKDDLAEIGKSKTTLAVRKGTTIFHAGDPARNFYCIISGTVQLFKKSRTKELSFAFAGAGAMIGHRDLLAETAFQHSARALSPVTTCKIPGASLRAVLARRPRFALSLMRNLADGWRDAEQQSYNLGTRKVSERLADLLLELRGPGEPKNEFQVTHTREKLATLLGITTESVIRVLSEFKAKGYIAICKGRITIKNDSALRRLVDDS